MSIYDDFMAVWVLLTKNPLRKSSILNKCFRIMRAGIYVTILASLIGYVIHTGWCYGPSNGKVPLLWCVHKELKGAQYPLIGVTLSALCDLLNMSPWVICWALSNNFSNIKFIQQRFTAICNLNFEPQNVTKVHTYMFSKFLQIMT